LLKVRHRCSRHFKEIAVFSSYAQTLENLEAFLKEVTQQLVMTSSVLKSHNSQAGDPNFLQVNYGSIPGNHARLLQAADTLSGCGGAQTHSSAEFCERDSSIALQLSQYRPVSGVKSLGHVRNATGRFTVNGPLHRQDALKSPGARRYCWWQPHRVYALMPDREQSLQCERLWCCEERTVEPI
jgi:hypothetical protein